MKKILILLMLAVSTATISNAQINCVGSNGLTTDTLDNAETIYFTTPANSLNAATSGKYVVQLTSTKISGTCTFSIVLEGTIDGTNYFKIHGIPGADGINCDTLTVTNTTGTVGWKINSFPGAVKYVYAATYYSGASRVIRLRVRIVGTGTQSTKIASVKVLTAL